MKELKNKMGRPRVSPNSVKIQVTISNDDLDLMKALAAYTGTRPATAVRELIVESRPVFQAMLEALEASKGSTKPVAGSLADKMLKQALKGSEPSQQDLLEMLKK